MQAIEREGLRQVPVGTELGRDRRKVRCRAHEDDRGRRDGHAPVSLHEGPAVHDRHAQVEEDERRLVDLYEVKRGGAVRGRSDGVSIAQRFADRVTQRVIVVDDQDARAGRAVAVGLADLPQRDLALLFAAAGASTAVETTVRSCAGCGGGWYRAKRRA